MRTFGTLSLTNTLIYGINILLYVLTLGIFSGLFFFAGLELGSRDGDLYMVLSSVCYLISGTVFLGGSIGMKLKVLSDAISIGLTMNDKSKNPFLSTGFHKPKPPRAVQKKKEKQRDLYNPEFVKGSDLERAKTLFPHWDEQTIRGYLEQGWTVQQLEEWGKKQ